MARAADRMNERPGAAPPEDARAALAPAAAAGERGWRMAAEAGGFIAAYVFLDWISYFNEYASLGITPWDPAKGLALAWLIRRGPTRAPVLAAAVLLAGLIRGSPAPWSLLAIAAALVAGCYTLTATALTRWAGFDADMERTRDVIRLLVLAAAGAAVVAAVHIALFVGYGLLSPGDFRPAALRQWIGDIIGIAVVTPTALRARDWRAWRGMDSAGRYYLELALAGAAIGGVLWVVFGLQATDEYKFFYLLFLPLVAIAVRRGIDGACLAALVTQIGLLILAQARGYSSAEVTDFQFLLLALTVTALLIGAVVSDRERAEEGMRDSERLLRERQSELEHSARLGALGEMASALAHELNQPMTASRAYIRTAQRVLAGEQADEAQRRARAAESIGSAVAQIDLAASILRNLRDLVRPRAVAAQPVDAAEIVDQAVSLLRPQARMAKAEIMVYQARGLKPVMIERIRVLQVILNLVRNALDAVAGLPAKRRRVEVSVRPALDQRFVEIVVRDLGPGVPEDMVEKLFIAFATSKPEGLGLGLSICRGIVQEQGGRLWLESSSPEGADFRFTLPVAGVKLT